MLKVARIMKKDGNQNAIVQAIQECLANIPFLQVEKVSVGNTPGPDFQVDVRVKNRSLIILAEYKDSGQPRIARLVSYQMKDWLAEGNGAYGIFIAPYVSPDAAVVCSEAGIGYLDLAGNCLLSFGTIHVQREGNANPQIQRRKLRSLYSSKAERILRVLLTKPQQNWKTETLAEATKVSYGQISNVKSLLADREWLDSSKNGFRLSNPSAVLEEWATQYRYQRNQVTEYYALANIVECESQLAEACQRQKIQYALTAFSGAARLAPTVRYQRASVYVDGDPDTLADSLGWKRVPSGANVSLLVPYDEGIFFSDQEIGGIQIVTPVQIYLDLQNQRGRGQEAAQAIRKVIEQSW
jgi:hypothetical protein